jgi:hypothetical protein
MWEWDIEIYFEGILKEGGSDWVPVNMVMNLRIM